MLSTIFDKPSAVALGTFDGLHIGHMAVINAAVSYGAQGLEPCVLLFDKHPQQVLTGKAPAEILPASLREKELEKSGVRHFTVAFEDVRNLTAREFVEEVLMKRMNAKAVCCGYDYRFGHDGIGDAALLGELCGAFGLRFQVVPAVHFNGEPVSSTRIRAAVENGELDAANAMLGRAFSYNFEVVGGKKLGRLIGIPTINQHFPEGFVIPQYGVYISKAFVNGNWHCAVTDIGFRPTFNEMTLRSETCISNFKGDLYGQHVEVGLLKYLRSEQKFDSTDELSRQIKLDMQQAQMYCDMTKVC
jgi:riboflavin kinase / FMN adenylyltransferase